MGSKKVSPVSGRGRKDKGISLKIYSKLQNNLLAEVLVSYEIAEVDLTSPHLIYFLKFV